MPFEKDEFIVSIVYLNNELVPLLPNLKHSVVDVRCVDNNGRHIIIEVQLVFSESFYNRVLFNAAKVYTHQLSKGNEYVGLLPVYSVNIIDDNMGFDGSEYYHHYSIIDKKYPERKLNGIEFLFIKLPKFNPTFSEKRIGVLWLKFLSQIENKTEMIPQELMEVPEIAEAISLLEESSYTKQELEQYDKYWDIISTQKSFIYDAEKRG
jgi:predicted transposase/invertase (TIGR01784 family)